MKNKTHKVVIIGWTTAPNTTGMTVNRVQWEVIITTPWLGIFAPLFLTDQPFITQWSYRLDLFCNSGCKTTKIFSSFHQPFKIFPPVQNGWRLKVIWSRNLGGADFSVFKQQCQFLLQWYTKYLYRVRLLFFLLSLPQTEMEL